jgi:hypothetical protein
MAYYPYLIASLPEPVKHGRFSEENLDAAREAIWTNLQAQHQQAFTFLLWPDDLAFLQYAIFQKVKHWKHLPEGRPGTLDQNQLAMYNQYKYAFPDFLFQFLHDHENNFEQWTEREITQQLYGYFFEAVQHCQVGFIREWLQFERDLQNLVIFFQAGQYGFSVQDELVPDPLLTPMLLQGRANEKKLYSLFPFMERLKDTLVREDPVRTASLLRDLKWEKLDELAGYLPFTTEQVFALYLKLQLMAQHQTLADGKANPESVKKGKSWREKRISQALQQLEFPSKK